jgi:hypothetical protein
MTESFIKLETVWTQEGIEFALPDLSEFSDMTPKLICSQQSQSIFPNELHFKKHFKDSHNVRRTMTLTGKERLRRCTAHLMSNEWKAGRSGSHLIEITAIPQPCTLLYGNKFQAHEAHHIIYSADW